MPQFFSEEMTNRHIGTCKQIIKGMKTAAGRVKR